MTCKNCTFEFDSNFCPNCGQPASLKRIDRHYIMHEIEHVLHFERGILYTISELITHPGQNIRNYLSENRSRLVKPIIFIILTSVIYTLISHWFHIEDEYIKYEGFENSAIGNIFKWIQSHYGYGNIIIGIFVAMWLKVLFKKYQYNFYELLIMLCFTLGITMLIYSVFAIAEGILHLRLFKIAGTVGVLYLIWSMGDFFKEKVLANYLKAAIAFILGSLTFYLLIFIVGIAIDMVMKHE
ncbi:MAG: DUF3667 domain-containing protein [Bacteroidetes bacterium]|nr:DUF3667 domain-containing protein [Bacteroidota bacterium]